MTDFISIKEAKDAKKGSIVATVRKIGDLKADTKDGKDRTRKTITFEDATDTVRLTAWNEEIKLFEYGMTYQIESGWWKEYNDEITLSLGNYGKVTTVTTSNPEFKDYPNVTNEEQSKRLAKPLKELPEVNDNFKVFVEDEAIKILQIEKIVKSIMQDYLPQAEANNPQHRGMITKEIYTKSDKTHFSKAGGGVVAEN